MRAVWSFWSAPYLAHYHRQWLSDRHHLLSWVLSAMEARKHYSDTCLVTDSWGAKLLAGQLKLPFSNVSTALDRLDAANADPEWWVLGKLSAYAAQTEPFVHIDNDVFLWRPLPERMHFAAVLAQNPEVFFFEDQSLYRIERFMAGIKRFGGWLPEEWLAYANTSGTQALCCGLFGGNDLEFIRHYATSAMEVIGHPDNQRIWPALGIRDNILVEQYFLAACLHSARSDRGARGVKAECLFPSAAAAFDPKSSTQAGYTHLIGDAKQNRRVLERLEQRVRRDYPEYYERCLGVLDAVPPAVSLAE